MSKAKVALVLLAAHVLARPDHTRVRFPQSTSSLSSRSQLREGVLPAPSPCPEDAAYCGDNPNLYPVDAIQKLVEESVALKQGSLTRDRFFAPPKNNLDEKRDFELACATRTSFIPRYARAKNLKGKWRYLVQPQDQQDRQYQISVCEHAGQACQNDVDSPAGEQTTVCRQVQRTHKLLSVDESGKMVVDSFPLPSACVCKFKEDFLGLRSVFPQSTEPLCPKDEVLEVSLDDIAVPSNNSNSNNKNNDMSTVVFGKDASPATSSTRSSTRSSTSRRPIKTSSGDADCLDSSWSFMCEQSLSYPASLSLSNISSQLSSVFGSTCASPTQPVLRNSFDLGESALCNSRRGYIFPQRARNVDHQWKFVVNTEQFKQGVSVMECDSLARDNSCLYGGQPGLFPHATSCQQLFTSHSLLAIESDGTLKVDLFQVPSACVCTIVDRDAFLF